MIGRLLALPFVAMITISACPQSIAQDLEHFEMRDAMLAQRAIPSYPPAPMPNPDRLVVPPQEQQFFPIRPDGQPFVLNQDVTVNLTDSLNRYYYNPHWRGEDWGPFNQYWIIERTVLMMPTYREYDEFSVFKVGNGFHKFFERYSGYGP